MSNATRHESRQRVEGETLWVDLVRGQVASLRFGTVLITVHDSRVVQVEKNEKLRLDSAGSTPQTKLSGGTSANAVDIQQSERI